MFSELAADYKRKKDKIQQEETARRKEQQRRQVEARRPEIEREARESKHTEEIIRVINILTKKEKDRDLKTCRQARLVKLALEYTDPEDNDQTMEYVQLSKVVKMITNKPGQLYKLPSVRAAADTTGSSSSNTSSEDGEDTSDSDRKGEKSKKTVRRHRREQRRKEKKNK